MLFICSGTFAQRNMPIIQANSTNAFIIEGENDERTGWRLDPELRPDIYITNISSKAKLITFCTDIDTIKTRLKPGKVFDFIVLLHGKDSCFTRILSKPINQKFAHQNPPSHDTIPFILTEYNNIKIKVCLNRTDTLFLKFDSGATGLLLTHEAIAEKTSLLDNQKNAGGGTAKPDYDKMNLYNTLQMGELTWDSLDIFPVVLSGQGTDGRFGWDLFEGRVLELDYEKNIMIVHSALPKLPKGYSKLPIEYTHGLFCINGTLKIRKKKYTNRFLFDSGYQRTIMLDSILMQEQNFPQDLKVIKKTIMKNGQGREIPVITVNNEALMLGRFILCDIPAQRLSSDNPARFKTHILGNEVLKRFNTVIDFYHHFIYLKPNNLWELPYFDAS